MNFVFKVGKSKMKQKLIQPNKLSVRSGALKGRGVFADMDIQAGEIVEECHFIISGCPEELQDIHLKRYVFSIFYNKNLSTQENKDIDFRSKLATILDDEEFKDRFAEEIKSLGYEDIESIFSSATVLGYGMIYNHSENNNIEYLIDYEDLCFRFQANKPIKKDEELFINYGNPNREDLS